VFENEARPTENFRSRSVSKIMEFIFVPKTGDIKIVSLVDYKTVTAK